MVGLVGRHVRLNVDPIGPGFAKRGAAFHDARSGERLEYANMRSPLHSPDISRAHPGLFHGVYSYQEAARLVGVTVQRIVRWADGYTFPRKLGRGQSAPVLQTERQAGVLSFEELLELFFVREYVALKIPLQHVRRTAEVLTSTFGAFPFSHANLVVNGRELIIENASQILSRPDVGQLVADFARDHVRSVEFRRDIASRYYPPEFGKEVYLDKEIRAGEPVLGKHAIPTRAVFSLWEAEQDIASVADYYDIATDLVSVAVRYEGQWRLAA